MALEELKETVGEVSYLNPALDGTSETPAAPGMLTKHYAPRTRIIVLDSLDELPTAPARCALLTLTPLAEAQEFRAVECLSPSGDLREAAANFFAALRRLDDSEADLIVAVRFPNAGLGLALNDRLRRAAKTGETG